MKKAIIAILGLLLLIAVGIGVFLALDDADSEAAEPTGEAAELNPSELFELAERDWEAGEFRRAYVTFREAATNSPEDLDIQWRYARASEDLNQLAEAQRVAEAVWSAGRADRDVLMMRLRLSETVDPNLLREEALAWIDPLEEGPGKTALLAEILFSTGDFVQSRTLWMRLSTQEGAPNPADHALRAAMTFSAEEDWEGGLQWLNRVEELMGLDANTALLKGAFLAMQDDYAAAESVLASATARFPENWDLRLRRVESLLVSNQLDAARDLVASYSGLTDSEEASGDPGPRRRLRLIKAFLATLDGGLIVLEGLLQAIDEESEIAEAERAFYRGLLAEMRDNARGATVFSELEGAVLGLPNEPLPRVVFAARLNAAGAYAKADILLREVRHPMYRLWPVVILETARALDGLGQTWTADTSLAGLHARGFYTAESLRLAYDMQTRLGKSVEARQTQELMANLLSSSPQAQYDRAIALRDSGRDQRAIEAFTAIATDASFPTPLRTQAVADLLEQDAAAAALRALENENGMPEATAQMLRARALETQGDIDGAQAAFEAALAARFSWETASNLANFWYRQERVDLAEAVFRDGAETHPDALWTQVALSKALLNRGAIDQALELAQLVWSEDSNSLDAATVLTEIQFAKKDWKQAETWAQRAIDLDNEREPNPALFYWLGSATLNQGNAQFARSWLSRAQSITGDDPTVMEALASCDFALGNHSSALEWLGRLETVAGELSPTLRSLSIQSSMRAERYEEALAETERYASDLGPENALALRALILEKQGAVPDALELLESYRGAHPDSDTALRLWVFLQARSGDITAGVARAREEGEWSENDWSELAGIAIAQKQLDAAILALETLTKTYPNEPSYWNNLAWIRLDTQGTEAGNLAAEEAEKARGLDPDNPDVIDTFARALIAAGRFEEAITTAEPWSKRQAASPRWHWYLGQAYEATQDPDQAIFHFREVKTLVDTGLSQGVDIEAVLQRIQSLESSLIP